MASPWLHTVLLVPLSALAGAALLCHRTPDLGNLHTVLQVKETPMHDLANVLEQTVIKQAGVVEVSESELNDYLLRRMRFSPSGASAMIGKLDHIVVDLEEDRARLHMCWSILGHTTVTSVDFAVKRTPTDFTVEVVGGAYGKLEVTRGLLLPLTPTLEKLAAGCKPEIDALFKFPHIRVAKDKLVLDPKFTDIKT